MKITKRQLKKIVKEEISGLYGESALYEDEPAWPEYDEGIPQSEMLAQGAGEGLSITQAAKGIARKLSMLTDEERLAELQRILSDL